MFCSFKISIDDRLSEFPESSSEEQYSESSSNDDDDSGVGGLLFGIQGNKSIEGQDLFSPYEFLEDI